MSTAEDDLREFNAFVRSWLSGSDADDLDLADLFDLWMLTKPADSEHALNVAAINASINDFLNGERGTVAGEHSRQLRERYGLSDQ